MNKEFFRKLLPQTDLCGIYHLPSGSLKPLEEASEFLDYARFNIDFLESGEIQSVLDTLGQTLGFPKWYGANLDALNDCLTDFSWHEASGYVFIISGSNALYEQSNVFDKINTVFSHAIEEWRDQNIPFWVFYTMRTNSLPSLPIQV